MPAANLGSEVIEKKSRVRSGVGKEPLQVRIPTYIKRAFKSHAALRGIHPNVLFVEVWEHYNRTGRNIEAEHTKTL